MVQLKQYWLAEALEKDLGTPCTPHSVMSFKRVMDIDETEEFPHEEVNWLYNWKLQHYYIPTTYGGEFTSFEEFVAFVRVLSRRDQTIAIAFTTLFWSFLTWMAGTPEQKEKLANFIKNQNGAMCLGYSEREHGSDLVGGELTATKVAGGYLLNGEKWPINRATISGLSYILAKTDPEGGSKCLTLFQVHKDELNPEQYYNLPKILTHGIRASDMSGIGFKDCFVPDSMRLGEEGDGLELALKGFQITRTLCAAFSHGAADTALRTTIKFALNRKLYNDKTVFELPQPRQTLVDAFLDILLCECETISSARGFHVIPEQFSVWAAVVKYFVPMQLETMINNVYVVLGSRFYFREEHDWGIFQKLLRDNSIISMFDGSSVVNLHALILQFRQLTKSRSTRKAETMKAIASRLEQIFSLEKSVPTFELEKLSLFGRGVDDPLQGLEIAIQQLQELQNNPEIDREMLDKLMELSNLVLEELEAHDRQIANSKFEYGHDQSPELFEVAKKYCTLHTAACCLHMWIYNRKILGDFFAKGEWLVLSLHRLLRTMVPLPYSISSEYTENITQEMLKLYKQDNLFSLVPFQLAQEQTQTKDKINASNYLQLQA
jgi:alkylation response protein AidB-like acyl-CoA dehydrogenase